MAVFVIAEIGINHNGNLELAKKLIDAAKHSGCDAVKFQKRNIDNVYSESFLDSPRESPWGTTQRDQKLGLEFSSQEYGEIDRYCNKQEIHWFCSAWDHDSQLFLRDFDLKFNKIASAMLVDLKFLETVASEQKPTFISTGMSTLEDIDAAVKVFNAYDCPFELMHCVSTYPTPTSEVNLRCISVLRDRYDCNVGYSGHENGIAVSIAAAALGATSIERHVTLDRSAYGSDQAASLEPAGLSQLVGGIRKIEAALGDGQKRFTDDEALIAKKLRAHISTS